MSVREKSKIFFFSFFNILLSYKHTLNVYPMNVIIHGVIHGYSYILFIGLFVMNGVHDSSYLYFQFTILILNAVSFGVLSNHMEERMRLE